VVFLADTAVEDVLDALVAVMFDGDLVGCGGPGLAEGNVAFAFAYWAGR
jgi:hypothetical protein